jgi:electron transport complex protein RnfG
MKHILKPALALFAIAAIATILLGLVRNITLEPIEKQRKKSQENTMKAVLSEADVFKEMPGNYARNIVRVYEGSKGAELIGYVIELSPSGYSGNIDMMVGISKAKNEITGMRVVRHTETPGLGAQAVKENFYKKYDGKKLVLLRVVKSSPGENDIEAITAATITTRAITSAVNEAIEFYNTRLNQGAK